MGSCETDFE